MGPQVLGQWSAEGGTGDVVPVEHRYDAHP